MKKLISFILCIILVISTVSVSFAAEPQKAKIPLVYVGGQGAMLVAENPDGSKRTVYPIEMPENFIEETVKNNIGIFAKAVVTQQWDEFCDVVYEIFKELYSEIKLDENGKPMNNTRVDWRWTRGRPYRESMQADSFIKYEFYYDWRLDPYENAEILHDYIEDVRAVTGSDKVALSGRCLGACVISAYMEKYDGEYVSDLIYYAGAQNGATQCSKAFCGELYIDADSVERFIYDIDISTDENVNNLIKAFVTLYNDTYGLDVACWSINNVYPKIYMNIVPRLLIDTFGTFPGFWSMVSQTDYLKAKKTVFHDADMEKYADFIKIIDDYHYNVQYKLRQNLKKYARNGINVYNIVKYGYQTMPVTQEGDILSDDICDVRSASMGATTAPVAGEFSKYYMNNAQKMNRDKFISPDKQIDASTCLFPERTWFVKNLEHKDFPYIIETKLFDYILGNEDCTVFTDESYPQYLVYSRNDEGETLQPMDSENKATDSKYKVSFFEAFSTFVKSLYNLVKKLIADNQTQVV